MKQIAKVKEVHPIENIPTKAGGTFTLRTVYAVDESNAQYPKPLLYQFSGNAVNMPDQLQPGMVVEFDWDVDGRTYMKDGKENVINNLRCWNFTILQAAQPQYNPQQPQQAPQQYAQPGYGQPAPQGYPQQQPQYAPQQQQYAQPAPAPQYQQQPGGYQQQPIQQQYHNPQQPQYLPPAPPAQQAPPMPTPPAYGAQQAPPVQAYGNPQQQQAAPVPPPPGNPYGNAGQQPVQAPPANPLYQPAPQQYQDKLPF
jgi:hypothetical protein